MNKESRSCNCITEHCAICFGCKTYKHCQCLPTVSTAKPASLSVKKRQLHEEYERKHIPRLKSVYDDKIGCEPSDGYDIYEYWDFGQHSGPKKSKRYIEHPLPGLAPTRMEKITPVASSSYTLVLYSSKFIQRCSFKVDTKGELAGRANIGEYGE